jgi:hypothetical protein
VAPLGNGYCWKNARTAALGPGTVQTPFATQGVSRVAICAELRVLVEVCAQVGSFGFTQYC